MDIRKNWDVAKILLLQDEKVVKKFSHKGPFINYNLGRGVGKLAEWMRQIFRFSPTWIALKLAFPVRTYVETQKTFKFKNAILDFAFS